MAASNRIESLLPSLNLVPSSRTMCCDCAISESASTHPPSLFTLRSLYLPCSQSHPRLVTSLHDLKLRRRRRFDVCANPRMRMWTCHGIQTPTTMEMETAPVAALHARFVFGGSARLGASLLTRMRSVSHSIRRNSPRQHLPSSKREKWRWDRKRDSNWSQPRNMAAVSLSLSLIPIHNSAKVIRLISLSDCWIVYKLKFKAVYLEVNAKRLWF